MKIRLLAILLFLIGAYLFPQLTIVFAATVLILLLSINAYEAHQLKKFDKNKHENKEFEVDYSIGAYRIAKPHFNFPSIKFKRGVLLIHGFSASTSEFKGLVKELVKSEVPFLAPTLTGFGLYENNLLKAARAEDWKRDVVYAYNQLSEMCEVVDVIGHSMGGLLALHLASLKPINKLILTSPYLKEKEHHTWSKKFLLRSNFSFLIKKIKPVIVKSTLSDKSKYESERLVFSTVPIQSIESLWKLTENIDDLTFNIKEVHCLFGVKDSTIELGWTSDFLNKKFSEFSEYFFEESGHNVLEDRERIKVIEKVCSILKS